MTEDNLSPASITSGLETRFIGQNVIYYPSVTSTNDIAKLEAQKGATEGTVVIADEQTAGKGRIKRVWLSPKGTIAVSVILYPHITLLPSLIMMASLAVVHTIFRTTGLTAQIKWPNDVLINGKKVCGILIESDVKGNNTNYAVIGIGLNVNLELAGLPDISLTATSLSQELGRGIPRLYVIQQLLTELERLYLILQSGGGIYEEWRDRLVTLGKKVKATSGDVKYEGIAEAVTPDGSLLLRHPDGKLLKIIAGDVTLRE